MSVSATKTAEEVGARLFALSMGVFFIGGFLSSTISLFVPRMTLIYGLSYTRALLIQLAFHSSYLLFAVPITLAIMRLGYMRSVATGLSVMATACTLFLWSQGGYSYVLVLFALLALSAGITFLQISANTVVTVIGSEDGAAFRLNLLQAFNSFGTVLAPIIGAPFLLGAATAVAGQAAVAAVAPPFAFAIVLLLALATAFILNRNLLHSAEGADMGRPQMPWGRLLSDKRLMAGTAAIFVYVGAEVTIGALLTDYLVRADVLGASPVHAASLVSFYWGGAMLGRAVGAFILKQVRPARLLVFAAAGATLLTLAAALLRGDLGAFALLAVGLCNSIMYPTIYVLALPREPSLAAPGSTLLCMAVVGGAVIPMLTGVAADAIGLAAALVIPAACYIAIASFAQVTDRKRSLA